MKFLRFGITTRLYTYNPHFIPEKLFISCCFFLDTLRTSMISIIDHFIECNYIINGNLKSIYQIRSNVLLH